MQHKGGRMLYQHAMFLSENIMRVFCGRWVLVMTILGSVSAWADSVELDDHGDGATVTATIEPNVEAIGKPVNIWISAVYNDTPYFYDGAAWVPYTGGALPIAMKDQLLSDPTTLVLLRESDLSTFSGAALYVGWGTSEEDMQSSAGKLRKVHQVGKAYPWPPRSAP